MAWGLTKHARERAKEMNVPLRQVFAAAKHPAISYPSRKYPGTSLGIRDGVMVAVDPAQKKVITVLWFGREGR